MTAMAVRVRELRAARRLSQRELAERAGIQFEMLARLCEVLDCEPGELFELVQDQPVPVLGGPDEDDILRERLRNLGRRIDGLTSLEALLREEAGSRAER